MDILGKPWIPKTEMKVANKALQVTAHKAPNLNADVGEKTMNTMNIARRLAHVMSLVILFTLSPGCTSLCTPVEITQADIDYFRSEALRMVTDGAMIERDNGKTLIPISPGEYDARKPITYRVRSGGHPRFFVTIPMVTRTGGQAQELEFDMATRQPIEIRISLWEY